MSDSDLALVYERMRKRYEKKQQRARAREDLKNQGNDLFKKQRYEEASDKYEEAIRLYGRKPVILSNLAAAYLKMGEHEMAEEVATEALIYDPKVTKARYRRGMARKETGRCIGAAIDFDNILKHEPSHSEALRALREVEQVMDRGMATASDEEFDDEEYAWPVRDTLQMREDGYDSDSASDSSDCGHSGNGEACRAYNHGGCSQKSCSYSHAPDDESIRDTLGKNVCLFYILSSCQRHNSCPYSHDSRYLPEFSRWWDDPDLRSYLKDSVMMAREIRSDERYILSMIHEYLYENGYGPPHDLTYILDQGTRGRGREVRTENRPSVPAPTAPPLQIPVGKPFIMAVSLDKGELFQRAFSSMIATLQAKVFLQIVTERKIALELLANTNLIGVLVSDPFIIKRKHSKLASSLVQYTKAGGLVVFGGAFSGNINRIQLEDFFRRVWGLPWKMAFGDSSSLTKVKSNETIRFNPSLPSGFDIKRVSLAGTAPESRMYKSTENCQGKTAEAPAPIVHAKFGDGYLGYIGNVNAEAESTKVVLAMFGLSDHKYKQAQSSKMSAFRATLGSSTRKSTQTSQSSSESPSSFVLVLSLENEPYFNECHAHVLTALRRKIRVVQALTEATALTALASPNLAGVFVTDPGVSRPGYAKVLSQLVRYTKAGGLVAIGGFFSGQISPNDMGKFFRNAWGLSWKMGSYHRTTHSKNPAHETTGLNPSLDRSYSMKAVHLKDINIADAVYRPMEESYTQSLVFPSQRITNLSEAPVVHTKIGKGYLGFLGDVNAEEGSTKVILAMLGLLDHGYSSVESASSATLGNPTGTSTQNSSTSGSTSFVMLLSLENQPYFEDCNKHVLSALRGKTRVVQALTEATALTSLALPNLVGVFVTDLGITQPQFARVLSKLIEYTKAGGLVVFGGFFSHFEPDEVEPFFCDAWGLPWKIGSCHRTTHTKNAAHETCRLNPSLDHSYCVKAIHVKGINVADAVYKPEEGARTQSHVFTPERIADFSEVPVVHTRIGKGYLGYIGDVNAEDDSTKIVLAMLGLLDHRYSSVGPAPSNNGTRPSLGSNSKTGPPSRLSSGPGSASGPKTSGSTTGPSVAGSSSGPNTSSSSAPQNAAAKKKRKRKGKGKGKAASQNPSPESGCILIISFMINSESFAESCSPLIDKVPGTVRTFVFGDAKNIKDTLASLSLLGVFVSDPMITKQCHAGILESVVQYAKNGGTVVFGGLFSTLINIPTMDAFWERQFGLPFKMGSFRREECALNLNNDLVEDYPWLKKTYDVKAVRLRNVGINAAVYAPHGRNFDREAPVFYARVADGYVGWIGDVNAGEASVDVVLAMLGLLD